MFNNLKYFPSTLCIFSALNASLHLYFLLGVKNPIFKVLLLHPSILFLQFQLTETFLYKTFFIFGMSQMLYRLGVTSQQIISVQNLRVNYNLSHFLSLFN